MPFAIRLKGGAPTKLRDGRGLKDPMKDISSDRYVLFKNLPACGRTPDLDIVDIETEAELKEWQAKLEKENADWINAAARYRARVRAKMDKQLEAGHKKAEEFRKAKEEAEKAQRNLKRAGAQTTGKPARLADTHRADGERAGSDRPRRSRKPRAGSDKPTED